MEKKLENEVGETDKIRFGTLMIGTGRMGEYRKMERIPCWKGIKELEETLGAGNVVYDNIERHNVGMSYAEKRMNERDKDVRCNLEHICNALMSTSWTERKYGLPNKKPVWILDGYYIKEKEGKYHIGIKESNNFRSFEYAD